VKVEREVLLPLDAFAGLPSNTRVMDLKRRLRCDSCRVRGRGNGLGGVGGLPGSGTVTGAHASLICAEVARGHT